MLTSRTRGQASRPLRALALGIAFVLSGALAAGAEKEQGESKKKQDFKYPAFVPRKVQLEVGEKLTYRIHWTKIAAGEASMAVVARERRGGREAYRVQVRTRSNKFVDKIYKVRDRITTWIDVEEGNSVGFEMKKREGRHRSDEKVTFDYENNKAVFFRNKRGQKREINVDLPGKVQDALSVLYYYRFSTFDEKGAAPVVTVATNRKVYKVKVDIKGSEKIKALGKIYDTIKIIPKADFPGIFVRKGEMTIWLEKKTHIPLLMVVDVPIGSVKATLVKVQNAPLK
jgi:hypothetical protein